MTEKKDFTSLIRENRPLSLTEKLHAVASLSLPGILAQISEIVMQYIDAAMVGSLGAKSSASIGLAASSTWLFGGLLMATAAGFSVQAAHATGAGDPERARSIFRQSILVSLLMSLIIGGVGAAFSFVLPRWLGADPSLWQDTSAYFLIFALFAPVRQLNTLGLSMLQCTGNMKTPSLLSALMCALDVVLNAVLIFPSRTLQLAGFPLRLPGAGLGVAGAQLGTSLSVLICMLLVLRHAMLVSPILCLKGSKGRWLPEKKVLRESARIGLPMAFEHSATSGAQVVATRIVAPLGTVAIAANAFAVTAESICYMPGYGIGSAATTMVGQAFGAKRRDLSRSFAWLTVLTGMIIMGLMGAVMYLASPLVFRFLTPDPAVQKLGVEVLRIELLVEPLFAASIVASGALRGAGDTLVPGLLNLISIWGIRLSLAAILSRRIGLRGVWIAMAVELSFLGLLFLIRLKREKWLKRLEEAPDRSR